MELKQVRSALKYLFRLRINCTIMELKLIIGSSTHRIGIVLIVSL